MIAGGALQLDGVFEHQNAVASGGDLRQQGVCQRGLARAGATGNQNVLALTYRTTQKLGLLRGHHAVGDVARQRNHAHSAFA